jgi:predicted DNA-binding protein with PD1-like motif
VTGVGALQKARYHVIASNNYPPGQRFIELPGPLEIAQLAGIIGGGIPHLHMTLLDGEQRAWGGHLEAGSTVLTLCELSIQRLTQTRMLRGPVDASGVKVLQPATK